MPDRGKGQYDLEYANCECFWGTNPGKFVQLLVQKLSSGNVLDLGAGEGKNAIYMAGLGFKVTAIECSSFALRNFRKRLETISPQLQRNIHIHEADALTVPLNGEWDAVIAYGLLHCLSSIAEVKVLVRRMQQWTKIHGWNVLAAFTNELPVPDCQRYLEPTLLEPNMLGNLYRDWHIEACENSTLMETHPTSNIAHLHSICRLLARRVV